MDGAYKLTRKIDLTATPAGRPEKGITSLFVMNNDNMMYHHTMLDTLVPTDTLRMAHVHLEDVNSDNGDIYITLAAPGTITGKMFKGMEQLTAGKVDTLARTMAGDPETYINVHSKDFGGGLVRGDLQP